MTAARRSLVDIILLAITVSLLVILASCVSLRQAIASLELGSLVGDLPYPPNAVLLETVKGVDSGSDKQCYTLYVRQLYGTNQQFSKVRAFYEKQLVSERTWQTTGKLEEEDKSWISFKHNRGFRLGIVEVAEVPPFQLLKGFSEDILTEGLNQFLTLYSVGVSYADAATRARCWNVLDGG